MTWFSKLSDLIERRFPFNTWPKICSQHIKKRQSISLQPGVTEKKASACNIYGALNS